MKQHATFTDAGPEAVRPANHFNRIARLSCRLACAAMLWMGLFLIGSSASAQVDPASRMTNDVNNDKSRFLATGSFFAVKQTVDTSRMGASIMSGTSYWASDPNRMMGLIVKAAKDPIKQVSGYALQASGIHWFGPHVGDGGMAGVNSFSTGVAVDGALPQWVASIGKCDHYHTPLPYHYDYTRCWGKIKEKQIGTQTYIGADSIGVLANHLQIGDPVRKANSLAMGCSAGAGASICYRASTRWLVFRTGRLSVLDYDGGRSGTIDRQYSADPVATEASFLIDSVQVRTTADSKGIFHTSGGRIRHYSQLAKYAMDFLFDSLNIKSTLKNDSLKAYALFRWVATANSQSFNGPPYSRFIENFTYNHIRPQGDWDRSALVLAFDTQIDLVQATSNFTRDICLPANIYITGALVASEPTSCCTGTRGNVNMAGIVDLADLSALVSYLTGGGFVLPCVDEANVNGVGIVDLADLSALVSYLTGGGFVLPSCAAAAAPAAKPVDGASAELSSQFDGKNTTVFFDAPYPVRAVQVDLAGEEAVTPTNLLAGVLDEFHGRRENRTTVILIDTKGKAVIEGNKVALLTVPGKAEITGASLADLNHNTITPRLNNMSKPGSLPTGFNLDQNYPNPFNPTTQISFSLPTASAYTLTIYNVNGQKVTEFSGAKEAGSHSVTFDGKGIASGVYFYRLVAGDFAVTRKMILLK